MIDALVNVDLFTELLALGGAGFLGGVVLPLFFRIVGYVIDMVKLILL